MRRKTSQQADRILDAAGHLFGDRPFHEVRMEDISAEAGVGKGTLYRYFHTKDDLYLKLLERAAARYTDRIRDVAGRSTGARCRLVALVGTVIAFFDEQPRLLELIQRAEVERGGGPGFPWQEARTEFLALVGGLFREVRERGESAVADPEMATLLLAGGLRVVLLYGQQPRPADVAERAVAALLGCSP